MNILFRSVSSANPQSRIKNNLIITSGAAIFAQCFNVVASPILTRLYSPEEFGLFSLYLSIFSVLAVTASLRFEMLIPNSNSSSQALGATKLSLVACISSSACLFAFFNLTDLRHLIFKDDGQLLTYLLCMGVMSFGILQIATFYFVSRNELKYGASAKVIQAVVTVLLTIVFSMLAGIKHGLVMGYVSGTIVAAIFISIHLVGHINKLRTSITDVSNLLRKYSGLIIYGVPGAVISALGVQLVPLALFYWHSAGLAGQYGLTYRILGAPAAFMGQAIFQSLFPEIKDQDSDINRLKKVLAIISIAPIVFCISTALLGRYIIPEVFGSHWMMAGQLSEIFSSVFLVSFISSPLSAIAIMKNQQKKSLIIAIIENFTRILILYALTKSDNVVLVLCVYCTASVVIHLLYMRWVLGMLGLGIIDTYLPVVKMMCPLLVTALVLKMVVMYSTNHGTYIAVASVWGILVFGSSILFIRRKAWKVL